jgi:hypothetical protein
VSVKGGDKAMSKEKKNSGVRQLPIIQIGRKSYFVDQRLNEIRNIKNPHDKKDISPELIVLWLKNKTKKLDSKAERETRVSVV